MARISGESISLYNCIAWLRGAWLGVSAAAMMAGHRCITSQHPAPVKTPLTRCVDLTLHQV